MTYVVVGGPIFRTAKTLSGLGYTSFINHMAYKGYLFWTEQAFALVKGDSCTSESFQCLFRPCVMLQVHAMKY